MLPTNSIVSVLGVSLVLWWLSTGQKQATSIATDVALLEKIARPWLDRNLQGPKHSRVVRFLEFGAQHGRGILDTVTEGFQTMSQKDLVRFLTLRLPEVAMTRFYFAGGLKKIAEDVRGGEPYPDGPIIVKTVQEVRELELFTETVRLVLLKTQDLAVQILKKLKVTDERILEINTPLNNSMVGEK